MVFGHSSLYNWIPAVSRGLPPWQVDLPKDRRSSDRGPVMCFSERQATGCRLTLACKPLADQQQLWRSTARGGNTSHVLICTVVCFETFVCLPSGNKVDPPYGKLSIVTLVTYVR
jgi:hypothetical protein